LSIRSTSAGRRGGEHRFEFGHQALLGGDRALHYV
jgi:hypothetical protein